MSISGPGGPYNSSPLSQALNKELSTRFKDKTNTEKVARRSLSTSDLPTNWKSLSGKVRRLSGTIKRNSQEKIKRVASRAKMIGAHRKEKEETVTITTPKINIPEQKKSPPRPVKGSNRMRSPSHKSKSAPEGSRVKNESEPETTKSAPPSLRARGGAFIKKTVRKLSSPASRAEVKPTYRGVELEKMDANQLWDITLEASSGTKRLAISDQGEISLDDKKELSDKKAVDLLKDHINKNLKQAKEDSDEEFYLNEALQHLNSIKSTEE